LSISVSASSNWILSILAGDSGIDVRVSDCSSFWSSAVVIIMLSASSEGGFLIYLLSWVSDPSSESHQSFLSGLDFLCDILDVSDWDHLKIPLSEIVLTYPSFTGKGEQFL
jgi:hypothetical protein